MCRLTWFVSIKFIEMEMMFRAGKVPHRFTGMFSSEFIVRMCCVCANVIDEEIIHSDGSRRWNNHRWCLTAEKAIGNEVFCNGHHYRAEGHNLGFVIDRRFTKMANYEKVSNRLLLTADVIPMRLDTGSTFSLRLVPSKTYLNIVSSYTTYLKHQTYGI